HRVDRGVKLVDGLRLEVDARLAPRGDRGAFLGRELDRQQPVLRAVVAEDVREPRRDERLEAVVGDRPRCMLAARSTAEVGAGHEDRVLRQVEALLAPLLEQELAVAGPLDALQVLGRDDLVGVDVVARQVGYCAFDDVDRLHQLQSLMSTKWPSMAAAAAIWGLTRCERAPRPWRPSK